jgi:hypothetical protein
MWITRVVDLRIKCPIPANETMNLTLLSLASRTIRRGHPRISDTRGMSRMEGFTIQGHAVYCVTRAASASGRRPLETRATYSKIPS